MVTTIESVLKLPTLADAAVAAGQLYLWKKVTSVKVLRAAEQSGARYDEPASCRNELIVTSFDEVWEDPLQQRSFIRRIIRSEAAGLVIFSVVPGRNTLNDDIIADAEENCLPLLCVPGRNNALLCGQLVGEINAFLRDNENESSLTVTMLEAMSRNQDRSEKLESAAELLSEWVCTSLVLADGAYRALTKVSYGTNNDLQTMERLLATLAAEKDIQPFTSGRYVYDEKICDTSSEEYHLLLVCPVRIERQKIQIAVNAMKIVLNFLKQETSENSTSELVRAIIQDEPLKKYRLSAMFRINAANLESMWILHCPGANEEQLKRRLKLVRSATAASGRQMLIDIYERCIVLFMNSSDTLEDAETLQEEVLNAADKQDVLFCIENLPNTAEVRNIYSVYKRTAPDAMKIYPNRRVLSDSSLNMAVQCRKLLSTSPDYPDIMLAPMYRSNGKTKTDDLKEFLLIYLLDADLDINRAAKITYLHRNAVKYRIKALSDAFGFQIGSFPDTQQLMLVVGMDRLRE